ncbi:MAG TPA: hypothetical protein VHA11_03595 [Bryobacteraceae bacterium]|nr:hypothetical protein [Bryobacteraceae bacterium]
MVGLVMRIYSLAFHVFLGFVMIAVGLVSLAGGQHSLKIGFLPWTGATLTYCLLALGAAGVVLAALAYWRILPILFAIWSLFVVAMLIRGYFLSPYYLGPAGFRTAIWFTIAALLAFVGSALQARSRRQSSLS